MAAKPKRAKPSVKKRTRPAFTEESILALLALVESNESFDPEVHTRFSSVMEAAGSTLVQEFQMHTVCHVHAPRFQRFVFDEEGEWCSDKIADANPAFGFQTLAQLTSELQLMAAASPKPAVTAYLQGIASHGSRFPFILLALFSDEVGRTELCFGMNGGYRWVPTSLGSIPQMLELLMAHNHRIRPNFFTTLGRELEGALAEVQSQNPSPNEVQEFLIHWLQREMRPLGTDGLLNLTRLYQLVLEALKQTYETTVHEKASQEDALVKAHAKQVKQLRAQLEKSEMLANGSRARAQKMAEELKALRKQKPLSKSPTAADESARSIDQALDLLFTSP